MLSIVVEESVGCGMLCAVGALPVREVRKGSTGELCWVSCVVLRMRMRRGEVIGVGGIMVDCAETDDGGVVRRVYILQIW